MDDLVINKIRTYFPLPCIYRVKYSNKYGINRNKYISSIDKVNGFLMAFFADLESSTSFTDLESSTSFCATTVGLLRLDGFDEGTCRFLSCGFTIIVEKILIDNDLSNFD